MFRQLKLLALAASLVGAVALSGCGGGGFGGSGGAEGSGSPILDANPSPEKVAVAAGDDISAEEGRKVAETVSRLNLGLGGGSVSPEDVRVSHHRAVLDRDPFSASSGVPAARKLGVATTRALRGRGYKAFEFPVPAESPIMTVAVWISETPPGPPDEAPDPKTPGGKTDAPAKTIYVRLQVFVSPAKLGLAGSDAMVQDLETQEVAVQVKTPKPKPTCAAGEVLDSRWNVCVSLRPADNVCPGGTLPAGGRTQAELNAGLRAAARGGDAEKICEWLRRGAEVGDTQGGAEWSVLHEAVSEEHPAAAALLLANDADVNFRKEGEGWSPLDIAVRKENAEIAALLRGAGGLCFLETGPLCSDPSPAAALVTVSFSWSGLGTIWAESGGVRIFSPGLVPQGSRVTFRAVAAAGHYAQLFAVYGGDCVKAAGGGLDCVAGSGVANLSSSARFVPHRSAPEIPKVAVNFSASGLGFGTISAQSGGDFLSSGDEVPQGATVIFTAIPLAGHYVSGWGGACAGSYFADGLDGSAKECRLMADAALSVEARFSAVPSLSGPLCPAGSLSANGMTQAALDARLLSAAEANDLSGACEWLRRGANVEARESSRDFLRTALMIAAGGGFLELAKLLHANGADVNLAGGSHGRPPRPPSNILPGWTALHYAATAGHADMVSWLLDSGAAIDAVWTRGGKTALWEAAGYGRVDAVAALLSRGADVVRKEGYRGTTPLHAASWLKPARVGDNFVMASYSPREEGSDAAVVSLLLSYSAEVNARADDGWSALDFAADRGRARIAEILRNAGGRCFVQSGPLCGVPAAVTAETVCAAGSLPANGMTQAALDARLLSAAEANDLSGACEWLRRGADVEAQEASRFYRRTALMVAANDGYLEMAKLLHMNDADVNFQGGAHQAGGYGHQWAALHYASSAGHLEMVRWLLDNGADMEIAEFRGRSPLFEAAFWGRGDVLELLLSRGAAVDAADQRGMTALYIVAMRLEHVPADGVYRSALHGESLRSGYSEMLRALVAAGADVNAVSTGRDWDSPRDYTGHTILDIFARLGDAEHAAVARSLEGVCLVRSGPLCGDVPAVVTAETVCAAGSLPANGMTQAALDQGLIAAALENDLEGACESLRRGADVNAEKRVARGVMETALIVAASYGRMELAQLLIRNGAEVNLGGEHSRWRKDRITPLMAASGLGRLAMAEFLISQGAEIDAVDTRGRGALYEAAHSGRWAIVEMLLARGADVNLQEGWGETPLYGALVGWDGYGREGYAAETLNWVRERGATRNPDGIASWVKVINALLAGGADANLQRTTHNWAGPGRAAALDYAARLGHSEFARILREADGKCFVEAGPLCGDEMVAVELSASGWGLFYAQSSGRGGSMFFEQGEVMRGATVIFTAAPSEGHYVSAWGGECAGAAGAAVLLHATLGGASDAASKTCALVATRVLNVNAVFAAVPVAGPGPATILVTVANTVVVETLSCPAGSLPANGLTQAELNLTLRAAARGGDSARVCEALRRGAEVNDNQGGTEFTPLQEAVHGGHLRAAELLLANGAEVNARKEGLGPSPLDLAAKGAKEEIARVLRAAGGRCFLETGPLCGVAVAGPGPVTILATTVAGNVCPTGSLPADGLTQAELNQGLLDEVHDAGDNGNWDGRKKAEICDWLRRGADINSHVPYDATTNNYSGSPLHYAAWATALGDANRNSHFSEIVEFLIANGANVNKKSRAGKRFSWAGEMPLFLVPMSRGWAFGGGWVVGYGNEYTEMEEITGILLKNGADVRLKNQAGRTALLQLIKTIRAWGRSYAEGFSGVVGMLLDAGSAPDVKDNEGLAALHYLADDGGLPGMAEVLLRGGADVNVKDAHDDTPLHYVMASRNIYIVKEYNAVRMSMAAVLLEHGADVLAENSQGKTPLQVAQEWRSWSYSDNDRRQWYSAMIDLMEAALPSPTVVLESRSVPVSEDRLALELRGRFGDAFDAGPAFGDSFGAVAGGSGSSGGLLSRLDGVMRGGVSAKEDWAAFSGWQQENTTGRLWFSTRHRGDFGFGAGGGGMGGAVDGSPFAALSGNGLLAGGEMALGSGGSERLRFAAFGDLQSRSLLSGEERRWTDWAASGTAIETAMAEAERLSGVSDNRTRGALTEIHLGDSVGGSGLAFQAGALSESESLLSGTSRGEDLRGLRSRTAFAGVSGSADLFGGGWRVRGAAHVGRSWAESSGVLRSGDLWASSFSAGLERGGWLYSGDGVMFRISQPLRVESWEMDLMEGGEVRRLLVSPSGRQLDLDAAYRLPLSGGGWLLLSAGVRRGSGHVGSSGLEGGALFSLERDF